MADTTKKTKTTPKPRTAATKAATRATTKKEIAAKGSKPSREEIERLAKTYWEERGCVDGYAELDWLRAEKELLKAASSKSAS